MMLYTVLLRINAGGVHLIFEIFGGCLFKGGVFRGRRLLRNTEKVTILYINVNDLVVFFYPKNGIILFVNHINTPIPVLVQIVEEE